MIARRVATTLPIAAAAVVGWKLLPPSVKASIIQSSRRAAAGLAARIAFRLWREADVAPADGLDVGSAGFDWRIHPSEAAEFLSELEAAGVWAHEAGPLSDGHDAVVMEKLQAAGIQLDQEAAAGSPQVAAANRYVGTTSPQRLVNALSSALSKGRAGLIVDTTGTVIEIDLHRSVGAGLLILVDENGAHLLRSGTNRALLQAIQQSSERLRSETAPATEPRDYLVSMPDER